MNHSIPPFEPSRCLICTSTLSHHATPRECNVSAINMHHTAILLHNATCTTMSCTSLYHALSPALSSLQRLLPHDTMPPCTSTAPSSPICLTSTLAFSRARPSLCTTMPQSKTHPTPWGFSISCHLPSLPNNNSRGKMTLYGAAKYILDATPIRYAI